MTVLRLTLFLCLAGSGLAGAQNLTTEKLGWIAGCWEIRTPTRVVEEYWMKPGGGMLMGMSRTVTRDTLRQSEVLAIRRMGDKLVYDATPSGQKQTLFPATVASADSVIFELPEHDFPQKVGYIRRGADSLVAFIEGKGANGQIRRIPYPYKRATCP